MRTVRNKLLFAVAVLVALMLFLTACNTSQDKVDGEGEEPYAVSISVDESSIPSTAYVGEFDVSALRLNVKYSDGSDNIIGANVNMVSTASRAKLNQVGTQMIEIVYLNCRTKFQVVLVEKEKKQYILRIYGGKPVAINDVKIEDEIEIVGDYYESVYDEGTVVTIEWIPIEGLDFNEWIDSEDPSFVDRQSITKATMNMNHTYRASGVQAVMTVNFETNCAISIGSQKTGVLYENSIPSLTREGYVFDGWTTENVTGGNAIDSEAKRISFPYNVTINNITLYGLWRSLGLEYIDYTNAVTGNTGKKITGYTKEKDTELTIPSTYDGFNVIAIDADAFKNATELENLSLPATIEEIGDGFLRNCVRLKEIELAIGSRYFSVTDGILYNFAQDELIAYPAGKLSTGISLSGVKVICDYAFNNAIVGGIELSSSLTEIGDFAFNSNHIDYVDFSSVNPVSVRFGNNLFDENISHIVMSGAFISGYGNIASMSKHKAVFTTNPDNIPNIGINDAGTILFKEIINPDSDYGGTTAEIIGVDRSVKEITIPILLGSYDVSSIGTRAFNGCKSLVSVIIPSESKLERILEGAFDNTPYLEKLDSKTIMANGILYKYFGQESTFVLNRDISRIAERAFYGNENLVRIDLRENDRLEYIGPYAFYGCTSLAGTVNDDDRGFYVKKGVERIANYAFAYSGITAFGIQSGNSLASIGKEAFAHCYFMKSAAVGSKTSDVSIESTAYLFCNALKEFTVDADNEYFTAVNGVLYASTTASGVINTLFMYPAGRMLSVFDISNEISEYASQNSSVEFNITTLREYAFFMSNVAALVLPETVININSYALFIPGLVYIKFARINNSVTFDDLFVRGADVYKKYTPEYVVAPADDANLTAFFGNNAAKEKYYREIADTIFVSSEDFILRINEKDGNSFASVIKSSRESKAMAIEDSVNYNGYEYYITTISEYAFMSHYLEQLTLGRRINVLESNSLINAENLTKLYLSEEGGIPQISENTFGGKFDNGLFIYAPKSNLETIRYKWGLSSLKYIIDIASGQPTASFGYEQGEEAELGTGPSETVTGEITAEWINAHIPVREGYAFEGWCDDNGNLIDFSTPYVIPYNIQLICKWKTSTYKVIFNIENNASLDGDTEISVNYGESYSFVSPIYIDGSMKFMYWKMADGTEVPSNGTWTYSNKGQVVNLYAVWTTRVFTLNYDLPAGDVTSKEVCYGKEFTLDIPSKDGFTFAGWALDENGLIMLTNSEGVGLLRWQYTDKDTYNIYSMWTAKEIPVSLYFTEGVLFKTVTQVYGAPFYFPYEGIVEEQWAKKAEIFCGWYGDFDAANGTGTGVKFTDDGGNGLFDWNVSEAKNLYAQWPLEISSGEELENLADLSSSVILTSDVTVTKPIGSREKPFSGTFIGNGYTVNFKYTVGSDTVFDGYVGLFARNCGTIKNLKLNAEISVKSVEKMVGDKVYIGAIAGLNEGRIINSNKIGTDISASINADISADITSYIGGFTGYNKLGTINNISMSLLEMTVYVNGVKFNKELFSEHINCGMVVGCMDGGSIGTAPEDVDGDVNEVFAYYYLDADDPFKDTSCGLNKTDTPINVNIITSQKTHK